MASRGLARLATITAIAAWLLVVVGGVVRVTGSGMGCPDWPYCFGAAMPPAHLTAEQHLPAWIEMAHRYAAGLVSLLVAGTALLAWRHRPAGGPWRWALASGGIIVVQIFLGAVTVWQSNAPWTVQAHLLAALLLVATTTVTALLATGAAGPLRVDARGRVLIGLTLALAMLGSVVQTTGGGWSCPDFPLCRGQLWPDLGLPAQLHMVHRLLAILTGVALLAVARPAWRVGTTAARRWALAAVGLYVAQFAVGIAQVALIMPAALRGAHLALAAGFWAAVVALVVRAAQAAATPVPGGASGPAPAREPIRSSADAPDVAMRRNSAHHQHPNADRGAGEAYYEQGVA